jgi:hypothetical protein
MTWTYLYLQNEFWSKVQAGSGFKSRHRRDILSYVEDVNPAPTPGSGQKAFLR